MCGGNNGHVMLAYIDGSNLHLCCEQSALDAKCTKRRHAMNAAMVRVLLCTYRS